MNSEIQAQFSTTTVTPEANTRHRHRHHHGNVNATAQQRNRRAIDENKEEKNVPSSASRPKSWINTIVADANIFSGAFKVARLISSSFFKPALPEETLTQSSITQVDAQIAVDGTILLLDVFIRKITGQKYISTEGKSMSLLEAQGHALNITEKFEKILNETAIKSGISVMNLNFNPVPVSSAIAQHLKNGNFSGVSKTLYSSAKEASPEFKQTGKFLNCLDDRLKGVLAEKEVELLSEEQKTINVDKLSQAKSVFQVQHDKPKSSLSDIAIENSSVKRIR